MEPPSQGGKCDQSPQSLVHFPSPAIPLPGTEPENTPAASLPDTRLSYCGITCHKHFYTRARPRGGDGAVVLRNEDLYVLIQSVCRMYC